MSWDHTRQRHGLAGTPLVVAADAGMLSAANLTALDELGLLFIVGSRVTKAPKDLESHFQSNDQNLWMSLGMGA
ncbi:hypothetical protein L2K20_30135 [Mycobacterium sp. MBM]|nr:hypothetical protein [Mycobacterium sp. MBM]